MTRMSLVTLALLLTLATVVPPLVVASGRVAPARPKGQRLAIVIGVSVYDNRGIPQVPFAQNDAEAVYDFLVSRGGYQKDNVKLLTERLGEKPTLGNIKGALFKWLNTRAAGNDAVFVYYAGRGAPETGTVQDGTPRYLAPRDADPESMFVTALALYDIVTLFRRLAAERVVFAIDACFSGSAGGGRTVTVPRLLGEDPRDDLLEFVHSKGTVDVEAVARQLKISREAAEKRLGRATGEGSLERRGPDYRLTARSRHRVPPPPEAPTDIFDRLGSKGAVLSASGLTDGCTELVKEKHGLFTYYLLRGLRGEADTDRDGVVTIRELFGYVQKSVATRAQSQNGKQAPLMRGPGHDLAFIELRR